MNDDGRLVRARCRREQRKEFVMPARGLQMTGSPTTNPGITSSAHFFSRT